MPRTRLKGGVERRTRELMEDFSPATAHWPDVQGTANSFFGWIVPTVRTSEYVVLQSVGAGRRGRECADA
jgi:hypothetical protein